MPENEIDFIQRPNHKPPHEDTAKPTLVTSRIQAGYGAVTPHTRPENFKNLREEFETGVAEDALHER